MEKDNTCPNCSSSILEKHKYCPHCGQKQNLGVPTLRQFFSDFFSLVLNLDAKIFHTLKNALIPGNLTKVYFKGARKKIYQPFRFFFVTAALFFGLVSLFEINIQFNQGKSNHSFEQFREKRKKAATIRNVLASIKQAEINDPKLQSVLDSIYTQNSLEQETDSIYLNLLGGTHLQLSQEDLLTLTGEQIIQKYNITNYWEQFILTKIYKLIKDPKGFAKQIFGQMIWMMMFLIPVFAFVLKWMYRKHRKYYFEHLILLFHIHAVVFLIMSLVFLSSNLISNSDLIPIGGILLSLLYIFLSLKSYYGEGWISSLLKFVFGLFLYLLLGMVFLVLLLLISFAVF